MSIVDKITQLQTAKSDIATAITTKGGTVAAGDGFADFAADIGTIPSGGSGDTDEWVRPSAWPALPNDRSTFEGEYFLYLKDMYPVSWFVLAVGTSSGQWKLERGQTDSNGNFTAVSTVLVNRNNTISEFVDFGNYNYMWYRITPAISGEHITSVSTRISFNGVDYSNMPVIEWIARVPNATGIGTGSYSNYLNVVHVAVYDTETYYFGGNNVECIELHNSKIRDGSGYSYINMLKTLVLDNSVIFEQKTGWSIISLLNIRSIDMSGADFSEATKACIIRDCGKLRSIKFPQNMPILTSVDPYFLNSRNALSHIENFPPINVSFSLLQYNLTVESLLDVLNSLPQQEEGVTKTLTITAINLAKLTEEQKAIATEKGWTLA